jgi:hypothetical protein
MKSIHFDGNDYIEMADGDYKTFGSNDFTIEAWVYPTSVGSGFGNYFFGDNDNSGQMDTGMLAKYDSSSKFAVYLTVGTNTVLTLISSNLTTPVNAWHKFAIVREGNTFTLFVNDEVGATATSTSAVLNTAEKLVIGRPGAYNGLTFAGYVSNFRIVKGTAVYSNSFTPPTDELTV